MRDRYSDAIAQGNTLLSEFKAALLEQIDPKEFAVESESIELDDGTIEKLKELGYLE
jgi:hypothetical protein